MHLTDVIPLQVSARPTPQYCTGYGTLRKLIADGCSKVVSDGFCRAHFQKLPAVGLHLMLSSFVFIRWTGFALGAWSSAFPVMSQSVLLWHQTPIKCSSFFSLFNWFIYILFICLKYIYDVNVYCFGLTEVCKTLVKVIAAYGTIAKTKKWLFCKVIPDALTTITHSCVKLLPTVCHQLLIT